MNLETWNLDQKCRTTSPTKCWEQIFDFWLFSEKRPFLVKNFLFWSKFDQIFPFSKKEIPKSKIYSQHFVEPMVLHSWSKFQVSKFIFEGEHLFWPFLHLKLGYEKMTKSQIEGCLRREGGVGGQIFDFGYSCAQFYWPLCDGSKNLQFRLVFILETLNWRVVGSILLRFWTNFEPMSQRKQ